MLEVDNLKFRLPNGGIRWVSNKQEARDLFDYLPAGDEANELDAILEVEYVDLV